MSSPTYDPTWWTNGISTATTTRSRRTGAQNNNAIQGLYTPGSTFKLATATAALQTGLITPGHHLQRHRLLHRPRVCDGRRRAVSPTTTTTARSAGRINVSQALTVSSDIFFYNLGVQFWDAAQPRYGETPIQDAADAARLRRRRPGSTCPTRRTSPGSTRPRWSPREHAQDPKAYPNGQWFTGNNLELAFGQGGTVITPLEQAVAYATFANGGTRYAPQVAAGIVDPTGKVVQTITPKVAGHVTLSRPPTTRPCWPGFEGVVQNPNGTGHGAFAGFPLSTLPAGGQDRDGQRTNGSSPTSWFVGWGPMPEPPVPDRRGRRGRGLRVPGRRARWSARASTTSWPTPTAR